MPQQQKIYYGWVIVGFTFALQFVAVGLSYYAFGVFLKPLTEALDADRFLVSLAMPIQSVVMGVLSPLAGRMFAQSSIKPLLFCGLTCLTIAFLSLTQITAVWQLYILYGGLMGVGAALLGVIPSNLLLANWFAAQRGRAMGISQFGLTISGTVLVPALTFVLVQHGWQTAFLVGGIGAAVVLTPLIALFAVKTPEERGLHPDGASAPQPTPPITDTVDWTFRRAITTRDIWCLTLTVGPCYLGISSVILGLPSHLDDLGLNAVDASFIVAMTIFMGAIAKPCFGTLADYFNKKLVASIAIALQATGVTLLLSAETYSSLLTAGMFFGLGYGAMSPLWAVMLAERYGRDAFAKVMGANMPMLMPFNIFGLPITTYVFSLTGTYIPAFAGLLVLYAMALIALYLFRLHPHGQPDAATNH